MTDIQNLWEYACCGDIENLKYYDDGGCVNRRYFEFGIEHSIVMGAFRNNQFETVDYLISVGEGITQAEQNELQSELKRFRLIKKLARSEEQQKLSERQSM